MSGGPSPPGCGGAVALLPLPLGCPPQQRCWEGGLRNGKLFPSSQTGDVSLGSTSEKVPGSCPPPPGAGHRHPRGTHPSLHLELRCEPGRPSSAFTRCTTFRSCRWRKATSALPLPTAPGPPPTAQATRNRLLETTEAFDKCVTRGVQFQLQRTAFLGRKGTGQVQRGRCV